MDSDKKRKPVSGVNRSVSKIYALSNKKNILTGIGIASFVVAARYAIKYSPLKQWYNEVTMAI